MNILLKNCGKNLYLRKKIYSTGEVIDLETGEIFDISNFYDYKYLFEKEIYEGLTELSDNSSLKIKLKNNLNKKRLDDLEMSFKENNITPNELRELIKLKYDNSDINKVMSYEHYSFLNLGIEPPNLTNSEIGKFYKMLLKMTHKANTILKTKNIKSNLVTVDELSELFNTTKPNTYKYLKKLKNLGIIKTFSHGEKEYMAINPKYSINGKITAHTYFIFKDDMEELFPNIPLEVIKLWEYEFINSSICVN